MLIISFVCGFVAPLIIGLPALYVWNKRKWKEFNKQEQEMRASICPAFFDKSP
jgi:hypothetical protein